jgi:hypothetical protein
MITDQQIRAITFLAVAVREELRTEVAAKKWNPRGVEENVTKVRSRSLKSVISGVTNAAADRNADTPGVIPTAGPHWRAEADDVAPVIERFDPATTCGICGKPQWRCDQIRGDHQFEAAHAIASRKLDAESAASIAAELRDRIKHTPETSEETA